MSLSSFLSGFRYNSRVWKDVGGLVNLFHLIHGFWFFWFDLVSRDFYRLVAAGHAGEQEDPFFASACIASKTIAENPVASKMRTATIVAEANWNALDRQGIVVIAAAGACRIEVP